MLKPSILNIDGFLAACEKILVVLLFSALVFLICFNIVTRNVLYMSFQKILEITPAFVLWLALLGSTLALKTQRHIRLELLLRYCSRNVRRVAGVITGIFGMVVMGILFYASLGFIRNEIDLFGAWGWLSLIFPLFFALSGFRFFAAIITTWRSEPSDIDHSGAPDIHKKSLP